jgi:hypothetical protein
MLHLKQNSRNIIPLNLTVKQQYKRALMRYVVLAARAFELLAFAFCSLSRDLFLLPPPPLAQ